MRPVLLLGFAVAILGVKVRAVAPEVAELSFDGRWQQGAVTNGLPAWVLGVERDGGQFLDQPGCWHVDPAQPVGTGRLSFLLDRQLMQEDLALTVLYEEREDADLVVQLFDADNRLIVLDLFANLLVVGKEAKTDTFIVPLRKYPSATKVTVRRIRGDIKVYGAALYPVVTEAGADPEALRELARLLGDPLSPDNPLVKAMSHIATKKDVRWLERHSTSPESGERAPQAQVIRQTVNGFWEVLPWPKDSNWPGPRGSPALVGTAEVLLQGQPVRFTRPLTAPLTIEAEVWVEERFADDGSFGFQFVPAGKPLDAEPDQMTTFRMIYRNPGAYSGKDALTIEQCDGSIFGKTVWGEEPFALQARTSYRVKLDVLQDRLRITVNGRAHEVENLTVPYAQFYVHLRSWQPTNRWHVRNFIVR